AGRQGNAVVSIPVGRNPRDFFFPVLAEDDQRIFSISFCRDCRRVSIRKLNRFRGNDMQVSLHETRRRSIIRRSAADRNQEKAADNQVLEDQYSTSLKSGRDRFSLPRPAAN